MIFGLFGLDFSISYAAENCKSVTILLLDNKFVTKFLFETIDGAARWCYTFAVEMREDIFMLTREELPECPVATTVRLIGNKWKLLIIRNLMYNGKQRFTDFLRTIPAISKKVLTDNLRALEEDGLVERKVFAEVPPRVEYSLSSIGKSLRPLLDAMSDWGEEYKSCLQ